MGNEELQFLPYN